MKTILHYQENNVIEDQDFHADFDGKQWTVKWRWKGNAPVLKNKVGCYGHSLRGGQKVDFEKEVEQWME